MTDRGLPRVLVITSNNFNLRGGGGITLTNLFRGWPADRLANVHEDATPEDRSVCTSFYRLTGREVRWAWPLSSLESRLTGRDPAEGTTAVAQDGGSQWNARRWLIGDGWPRTVTISPALAGWIDAFGPTLAYGFLGSFAQVRLLQTIADRWNLPVAVHMMDDWPAVLYRRGLLAPVLRRKLLREFRAVLHRATLKLAICDAMAREYERRYGGVFGVFHNALQMQEWLPSARRAWDVARPARVGYIGSILGEAQRAAIRDVAEAVLEMRQRGRDLRLAVAAPEAHCQPLRAWGFPEEALEITPAPPASEVPRRMAEADINLLPFNFDKASARYLRYSMPTKVPAYMISGTPILVYGPAGLAAVEYAQHAGWGHVVTRRGALHLRPALERLLDDAPYRRALGTTAQHCAAKNHDIERVRERFWGALTAAASGDGSLRCP